MNLGVAYYPEHWPMERWETDARLMQEAGITRVRMGEFGWQRMEPRSGEFDFGWLEQAIALIARHGIKTILGTPTATYPAWLHAMHPDIHQVKSDGQVKAWGQRQDACKNHPGYREHARRIVERMTAALGNHPDVIAWQTDNELGCHGTARCYCPRCAAAFRTWLSERFRGDIGALNAAWGTVFWSQTYDTFEQVMPPLDTADCMGNDGQNPGLVLDYYRFSSDVQIAFHREQAEIVRRNSPGRIVTHNLMGLFNQIDYFELAKHLDVVSWDNYTFTANGTNRPPPHAAHDLMRGLKQRPVWVMEQGSGPGGWGSFPATPQPGQMRLWAYQAVAHGADLINFFRWRSCRWGREQYWHGILYHHGVPQRRYEEAKQLGGELAALSKALDGTTVAADAAILFDYDSLWAFETQPHTGDGFDYREMATAWNAALGRFGVASDLVGSEADLSRYKLIVAPSVHVCTPELARRLEEYVRAGGTLVLGPRSGVKDAENAVVDALLPGLLRPLAGCVVEEYDAFNQVPGLELRVRGADGVEQRVRGLAEVLVPDDGVETTLTYCNHYYGGRPAAVVNRVGAGRCHYVGTVLGTDALRAFLAPVLRASGIEVIPDLPDAVEVIVRAKDGARFVFVLNHADTPVMVRLAVRGVDLLSGRAVDGEVALEAFGVGVYALRANGEGRM